MSKKQMLFIFTTICLTILCLSACSNQQTNSPQQHENIGTEIMQTETLGNISLGMTEEKVREIYGEPVGASNSGSIIDSQGNEHICGFYKTPETDYSDGQYMYDLVIQYIDKGTGYIANNIYILQNSASTLKNGLGIGSSRKKIEAAYASKINPFYENSDPNAIFIGTPDHGLTFTLENEKVNYISLGFLVPYPPEDLKIN